MGVWRSALIPVLIIKAVFVAILYLGWYFLPYAEYPGQDIWMVRPHQSFTANMANFDGAWHLRVAQVGHRDLYTGAFDYDRVSRALPVWDERGAREAERGFGFRQFPFLGTLLRFFAAPTNSTLWVGVVLVNVAALCFAALVYHMTRREWGAEAGAWAAAATAVVPGTIFLTALYVEAFNLLFVGAAMYAVRCGRWRLAAIAAGLAVTTRVEAILVVLPLAVEWSMQRRHGTERRPSWAVLAISIAPAIVAYAAILGWFREITGTLFINADLIRGYGHVSFPTYPWVILTEAVNRPDALVRDFPVFLATALVLLYGWRHMPWSYRIFWLVMQVLIISGSMQSYLRHSLLMVPLFPAIGIFVSRHPAAGRAAMCASAMMAAAMGVLFINGYWVG